MPPIFEIGDFGLTKQMLLLVLSVILIAGFFLVAIRHRAMVPGKLQFVAEEGYAFVRNSLGREIIGQGFLKWVPLLFTVFFFVLVNNIFGLIPILQLPSFSHVGSAYAIAAMIYVTWVGVGIKKYGLKFFKLMVVPAGVPFMLLFILVPIEIISNFIVRPVTHSLRLMATMLAGHLIAALGATGAEYLITVQENLFLKGAGIFVIGGAVAMGLLEALIMVLQAFVFALLTAIYIQGAEHADAH
ncbi:F-type H+-transporting ATPase subunit a [Falsarthrobacter nasiphocae]|uniref:ATP synthase subunit a n=1 Tax=Falsarthrobacter nasiphocae TaxID=189863 RepID=A0AAE3YIG5_9MICC|nr:F-type H+-transporting ATPase subunit a [Falsarthrobacter nasiphocae]